MTGDAAGPGAPNGPLLRLSLFEEPELSTTLPSGRTVRVRAMRAADVERWDRMDALPGDDAAAEPERARLGGALLRAAMPEATPTELAALDPAQGAEVLALARGPVPALLAEIQAQLRGVPAADRADSPASAGARSLPETLVFVVARAFGTPAREVAARPFTEVLVCAWYALTWRREELLEREADALRRATYTNFAILAPDRLRDAVRAFEARAARAGPAANGAPGAGVALLAEVIRHSRARHAAAADPQVDPGADPGADPRARHPAPRTPPGVRPPIAGAPTSSAEG